MHLCFIQVTDTLIVSLAVYRQSSFLKILLTFQVCSADNTCSEGTASTFDHSLEADADAEMEETGKVEAISTVELTGSHEPEKLGTMTREIELYPNATNNETFGNSTHEAGAKDNSNQPFYGQEWHHSNSFKHGCKQDEDEDDDEVRQGVSFNFFHHK